MRTTFEISEAIVIEARIEPASGCTFAVEGAHPTPTEGQMRHAARENAASLGKDLEDLGYGVRIDRAERESDAVRRRIEEERRAAALLANVEQNQRDLRVWRAELDSLVEHGRRLEYRARVERFKAHQVRRRLRR